MELYSEDQKGGNGMNFMEFLSKRFETELDGPLQFGDEVIDNYGDKAVVLRNPYPVGSDHELFSLISYGTTMASVPVRKLKKTGKSYAKELNVIFEGLKKEGAE